MKTSVLLRIALFMMVIFLMGVWHGMAGAEDQRMQYVVVEPARVRVHQSLSPAPEHTVTDAPNRSTTITTGEDVDFTVINIATATGGDACADYTKSLERERVASYSVVMTAYKGHQIITKTLTTWREAGVFTHPSYGETVIHVNDCTDADTNLLRDLLKGVKSVKILCNSGNRIWTVAFYNAISRTSGSNILFSENDRPIQQLSGESAQQLQTRVKTFLSEAIRIVGNQETPFVSLKKFISPEDEKMFIQSQRIEADADEAGSSGTYCWSNCLSRIASSRSKGESSVYEYCNDLMSKIEVVPFPDCEKWMCREVLSFKSGTGWGALCYPPMLRNFKRSPTLSESMISEHNFLYPYSDKPSINATRIVCLKVRWWNNEPAIYRFSWVKDLFSLACRSDRSRHDSGLTFLKHKPWFGRYGRRFETFFTKYAEAMPGIPHCYGDGLFTHYEPVSYDKTSAAG